MTEDRVPFSAAESEFTEKRSRFIGRVWRVTSEEEARAKIGETKKLCHDARHNCWCYLLREGGALRYSDDGEPQGTAGLPMLEVFRREGVCDVCCVVTRYFGGILLGAGGLTRAYARSAKETLDAAGVCRLLPWTKWTVPCTYPLLERVRLEVTARGGAVERVDYGETPTLYLVLPQAEGRLFGAYVTELSAGQIHIQEAETAFLPGPRESAI